MSNAQFVKKLQHIDIRILCLLLKYLNCFDYVALNHVPLDRPITAPEELEELLSQCYTGQDFIDECGGDVEKAERLFCYCDWKHPSSAVDELADDDEDADNHAAPSSTDGDYSPANPWDAPGMSVSDFI